MHEHPGEVRRTYEPSQTLRRGLASLTGGLLAGLICWVVLRSRPADLLLWAGALLGAGAGWIWAFITEPLPQRLTIYCDASALAEHLAAFEQLSRSGAASIRQRRLGQVPPGGAE